MGKSNILKFRRGSRPITEQELNELTMLKDTTTIKAVCRCLGRTDWDDIIKDGSFWKRGRWQPYDTGEEVFLWDNREIFLLGPIEFNHFTQKFQRRLEWLVDIEDFEHHTKEDEAG